MARTISPSLVLIEVERVMSARWKWGETDCCTSASDVFLAIHGIDPMAPLRGKYDSAVAAFRIIRDWGGFRSMASSLASAAMLKESNGAPGDIGVSPPGSSGGPDGRALLICIQPGHWAGKSELGFTILPCAEMCWRA